MAGNISSLKVVEEKIREIGEAVSEARKVVTDLQKRLNKVWKDSVKDYEGHIRLEFGSSYTLLLIDRKVVFGVWRYNRYAGQWTIHYLDEGWEWKHEEYINFIENFEEIVKEWIEDIDKELENLRKTREKVKTLKEKLSKLLE